MTTSKVVWAHLLLLLTMCIWGSAFAGIRQVVVHVSPMTLSGLRLVIAATFIMALALLKRVRPPQRADLVRIAASGVIGLTLYHVSLNLGLTYVSAGVASFVVSTTPIWTALLANVFLGERVTALNAIGLGLSFAGVSVLILGGDQSLSIGAGALIVLVAAVCAAINMVLQKELLSRYEPLHLSAYTTTAGALPFIFWLPMAHAEIAAMPQRVWLITLYLGVVPIGVGYVLSSIALRILPAARAAQMLLLMPPIAAVIAWVWVDEPLTWLLLWGGGLVLLGVLVSNMKTARA